MVDDEPRKVPKKLTFELLRKPYRVLFQGQRPVVLVSTYDDRNGEGNRHANIARLADHLRPALTMNCLN